MPNYNTHRIKARRSYNITEMASLLGVDRKTCGRWIQESGLKVIEKGVNPLLVMGVDLCCFLKEKRAKNKVSLEENELYCFKCRKAVKAKKGSENVIKTGKSIGTDILEQVKKTGFCEVCNTKLNKYLKGQRHD